LINITRSPIEQGVEKELKGLTMPADAELFRYDGLKLILKVKIENDEI
jgi:hypothetical protein